MNLEIYSRQIIKLIITASVMLATSPFSVGQQVPELVVQTGHSSIVTSLEFSPDGSLLASASEDRTVRIWEVSTGLELRTLYPGGEAGGLSFTTDSRMLIAHNGRREIVWDVASGREVPASQKTKDALAVGGEAGKSPDGNWTAKGYWSSNNVFLTDAAGKSYQLEGHTDGVTALLFSPDSRLLASGSADTTIKLWDLRSRTLVRTLKGHTDSINALAFSPDGTFLATGGGLMEGQGEFDSVKVWSLAAGQLQLTLSGKDERKAARQRSSAERNPGNEPPRPTDVKFADVQSLTFSRDGKALTMRYGGTYYQGVHIDSGIKLWNTTDGTLINDFGMNGLAVALNDGGNRLSIYYEGGEEDLYEEAREGHLDIWDAARKKRLRALTFPLLEEKEVDGNRTAFRKFSPILGINSRFQAFALESQDRRSLTLMDARTGQIIKQIFTGADLSADNEELIMSYSGTFLAVLRRRDRDGSRGNSSEEVVHIWDVSTGKRIRTFAITTGISDETYRWKPSFAISPDGRTIVCLVSPSELKLWNAVTGQETKKISANTGEIRSYEFSPDGQLLAVGGTDPRMVLWEASTGKEVASLIALDEKDWLVVTPDGLFDGSPAAWKKILWRFNNSILDHSPVEAFFNEFYYPNLLQEIMAGKRPRPPQNIARLDRRLPLVKLTQDGQPSPVSPVVKPEVEIQIEVTEAAADEGKQLPAGGARDLRLFRNGLLVKLWRDDLNLKQQEGCRQVEAGKVRCAVTVPVIAGENIFTAYAFNRHNIKSGDATLTVKGADSLERKGIVYVLAVGVNEYANPDYDLSYSVADAIAFGEEVRRQQLKLKRYERTEVLTLIDQNATKSNVLRYLGQIAEKARPEDAVLIYFAGHGTAQQNRFFLVPHDLGYMGSREKLTGAGLNLILSRSISDEELEQAVEGVDAGQLSLVIDACNSGQALEAEEKRRGPMNSKGLAQLAYEKGMHILTAAQSYQEAIESSRLGHGYLTYALVEEGLKTARADGMPQDGLVTEREWLDYATLRVPQMQGGRRQARRKLPRRRRSNVSEANIQRPRVFYRREVEARPFIVAKIGS